MKLIPAIVTVAPVAGFATVALNGSPLDTARVSIARDLGTAVVGDQVLVAVDARQSWAIALLGTAPPPAPPADDDEGSFVRPPEQATRTAGTSALVPSWSGSFRGTSWRTDTGDLYQGDYTGRGIQWGASFFPNLDAFGTLLEVRLDVTRRDGGLPAAAAPTMRLLSGAKTSANPATLDTEPGPALTIGQTVQWVVPSGWLPDLASGTAGGIGIGVPTSTPYIHLAPLAGTVNWERT